LVVIASDLLMDRLVLDSTRSVYRSVTASELSQALQEQLTRQERRYRQYLVLGDDSIQEDLQSAIAQINGTISSLLAIPHNLELKALFDLLANQQKKIQASLQPTRGVGATISDDDFSAINDTGRQIYLLSQRGIYNEVETLHREEEQAEKLLFALASTCLPLTIILVFFLTRLITRPIKQIDQGLHLLGQGDFTTEITVNGPDDLASRGTRLNWLRQQLAYYEQEKNKFASHISHELKTPLASIHEAAELLGDGVAGPVSEQQREVIGILRKNCGELKRLIENLVGLTMAQAERACLQMSEFDLKDLVAEVVGDYKPAIVNNTLTLTMVIDTCTLLADRQRIKTVVDNLLSNAIKYTPSGGTITIFGQNSNGQVVLEIHDSGPGIPESEQEQIFSPFFHGAATTCRSHVKGTGLGLAIAKEYVAAHNGTLELVQLVETGACFRITLPHIC
ncbi:MAG: HAMP domain-containing sensor histidine kinase, partial [Desulfobulbaceae bacterium]|nr:HAMP domain-containing sensor histidine kinase [Desulfobulbaceae bacterium]